AALQDRGHTQAGGEGGQPVVQSAAQPAPQFWAEGALDAGLHHVHAPQQQRDGAGQVEQCPGHGPCLTATENGKWSTGSRPGRAMAGSWCLPHYGGERQMANRGRRNRAATDKTQCKSMKSRGWWARQGLNL